MDKFGEIDVHTVECIILTNFYGKKIPICHTSDELKKINFPNPVYNTWDHWKYMEPINEFHAKKD